MQAVDQRSRVHAEFAVLAAPIVALAFFKAFPSTDREILDTGIVRIDGAIREQHPRHEGRIDAMIAAPRFEIIFDHARPHFTDCGIPGYAVPGIVADNQIGRGIEVWTLV